MTELELLRAELADVKARLTAVEAARPKRGRPAMDKLVAWFRATGNLPVTILDAATGSGAPLAGAGQILRKHKGVLFRKSRTGDADDNRVLWSLIDPNATPPAKVARPAKPAVDPADTPMRKRLDKVVAFLESRGNEPATIRTIAAKTGEKVQAISLTIRVHCPDRFARSRMSGDDGLPWMYRLRTPEDGVAAEPKPAGGEADGQG